MSSTARKFGTFAGVYTPSVLTILGVIMYLRMGYVVGNNDSIWSTVGIILVAHIISVTTGLSVSSISTDKKIEAGGIYYILSRSLGLPIGGAIGATLFVGTALAIALYLVGFSESFIEVTGAMEDDVGWMGLNRLNLIRVIATCALIAITALAFISTSVALKLQFFILAGIVLSLFSIFFGSMDNVTEVVDQAVVESKRQSDWFSLFAIFFPAVTGFTAGVAMSGDLKNPKVSIPNGTMLSIATGLIIYLGLAIFIGFAIPTDFLIADENILKKFAAVPAFVVVGIWGATLSSAIGSLLGAPRILQAMATDKIGPSMFSKGVGPNNEPRNALILTFVIAEGGILIGSLNTIAEVVSMFYLAAYGFINLAQFLESWASSDYLPSFKVPKWVGLIGFIATFYVMMMLNAVAMVVALLVIGGIFLYLTRKELALGSGDVWQSVWSSVVKAGLKRMDKKEMHKRNWEPNILLFSGGSNHRPHLIEFSRVLAGRLGMISNFDLVETPEAQVLFPKHKQSIRDQELTEAGIFTRRQECSNIFKGIEMIASTYGFSGIEPNTILMGWARNTRDPIWFSQMTSRLHDLDYNVLYLDYDDRRGFGEYDTIDLWWNGFSRDCEFMLSLVKLVQTSNQWRNAQVRVLMINDQNEQRLAVEEQISELLSEMRIQAGIKVINNSIEQKSFYDLVKSHSFNTDLVFLSVPEVLTGKEKEFVSSTDDLVGTIGTTLLIRSSSHFDELGIDLKKIDVFSSSNEDDSPFVVDTKVAVGTSSIPDLQEALDSLQSKLGDINLKFSQESFKGIQAVYRGKAQYLTDQVSGHLGSFEGSKAELKEEIASLFYDMANDVSRQQLLPAARIIGQQIMAAVAAHKEVLEQQPTKIQRDLDSELIVKNSNDEPGIARVKRRKRRGKLFGIKPKININFKRLSVDRYESMYLQKLTEATDEFASGGFGIIHQLNLVYAELIEKVDAELSNRPAKAKLNKLALEFADRMSEFRASMDAYPGILAGRLHDLTGRYINTLIVDGERLDVNDRLEERTEHRSSAKVKARLLQLSGFAEKWLDFQKLLHNNLMLDYQLHKVRWQVAPIIDSTITRLRFGMFRNVKNELGRLKKQLSEIQSTADIPEEGLSFKVSSGFRYEELINDNIDSFEEIARALPEVFEVVDAQSFDRAGSAIELKKTNVKLKNLIEFMLESKLSQDIQEEISNIQRELNKLTVKADSATKLVTYTSQNPEVEQEQVEEVLKKCRLTVDDALDRVSILENTLAAGIRGGLTHFNEMMDSDSLITRATAYEKYVKREAAGRGVKKWFETVVSAFTKAYKIAARGILNKRDQLIRTQFEIENEQHRNLHGVVRDFVASVSISPEVEENLPFYYKQLFVGRHELLNEEVKSREGEKQQFMQAIARHESGTDGAILITGNALSGYNFLNTELLSTVDSGTLYQVKPPVSRKALSVADFENAMFESAEVQNWQEYKTKLNPGDRLVINDLERWFHKGSDNKAFSALMEFVQTYGGKLKISMSCGVHFYKYAKKALRLDSVLQTTILISPLSAEVTQQELWHRHQSGGLELYVSGKHWDQYSKTSQNRFLRRYHSISNGNVGAAGYLWLASIKEVKHDKIYLDELAVPNVPPIDNTDWLLMLYEVLIHREYTIDMAVQTFRGDNRLDLFQTFQSLLRAGLLEIHNEKYSLNPYSEMFVEDILDENGLI